jgi:hypothetical protein
VTERAKLYLVPHSGFQLPRSIRTSGPGFHHGVPLIFVLLLLTFLACAGCADRPRVSGVYAPATRVLLRIDHDDDADGRIDVRTYMRNGRPVRLEVDTNDDGVIDRWEYYARSGELVRVGASSAGDGHQDRWVRTSGDERYVEISTERDGRIDRREVYNGARLVRVECDTNRDGIPDMWEEFEGGAIARLLLDDHKRNGRPTRRIVYEPGGAARVELLDQENGRAPR